MKQIILFLFFLISISCYAEQQVKTIYQYKDDSNVTEFTDTNDSNKTLINELSIKSSTETQKQNSEKQLEKIRAYNKDFNQRYYDEKKRNNEARKRKDKEQRELKKRKKEAHDEYVSDLSRHKRKKHLTRDRIRQKKGKPAH